MGQAIESRRGRLGGPMIGIGVTLLGCAALGLGFYERVDNFGLDFHFRYLSTIEADPRMVLIDINDHALRAVGDWPWPRRRIAQLVSTLDELGAEAIVLDLVLSEPAAPRRPSRGEHYDVDRALITWGDGAADREIFDDDELQRAIAEAGNVYLAMFFRLAPPGVDPSGIFEDALALVRREPGIEVNRFAATMRGAHSSFERAWPVDELLLQARIVAALETDFGLGAEQMAEAIEIPSTGALPSIETHLPAAKQIAALRLARRFLARAPDGSFTAFFESVLPLADAQAITRDREDLIEGFRKAHALRSLTASTVALPHALSGVVRRGYELTLPLDKFSAAAKGIGFVSFQRDERGGVVREIPLVADVEGSLVPQLGVAVALDALAVDRARTRIEGRWMLLGRGEGQRRASVTDNALSLLNWHVPGDGGDWPDSFVHLPVSRVLEVPLNGQAVAENRKRLGLAMGALVKLRHAETPAEYAEYVRLVNERLAADREDAPDAERSGLESQIRLIEEDAMIWLRRVHQLWQSTEPTDDEQQAQRDAVSALHARLVDGAYAARIESLNDSLATRTAALIAELRPRVEGKICLVGYTASGMADLVSSPVFESVPGVMAHANVINMFLANQPAFRGPLWGNLLIMLGSGVLITFVGSVRGPRFSVLSLVVVVGMLCAFGGWVFWVWNCHVASLASAGQTCVAWACVTAYRQFTEERVRRQFQRALAQYTSPAVAARIASSADVTNLAPQPAEVTCFFSDLQGFTPLSEQLGAERTRAILNPYLRAMSRVLVEHQAIINKFMGDGIFAFFNAPILPCRDHAGAACACALASLEALRDVNREWTAPEESRPLVMRIGIATGGVFVGDYGSDTKLDYTCIGDTVNLASRLESANKGLGTTILVNDECRRSAGDRFAFQSHGGIEVPGVSRRVVVHELIGLTSEG